MSRPEELEGTRVAVTGGAGFIGSHLVTACLEAGASVCVLDDFSSGCRSNLEHLGPLADRLDVVEGDIRDPAACAAACEDAAVVFHQAALGSVPRSMKDPARSVDVNVAGTAAVFAAARDAGVRRVVYASSSSVYGDSETLPKREGEEGKPLSPYATSKVMGEELADVYGRCFDLELVGLRYFNVFGPRQSPEGPYAAVVPLFVEAYLDGRPPHIHGDGTQSRDFTWVGDAVAANLLAAVAPAAATGRAYNVAGGRRVTLLALASMLREIVGGGPEPEHGPPRPGDVRHSEACLRQVGEALGYAPRVGVEEGLRQTVAAARAARAARASR